MTSEATPPPPAAGDARSVSGSVAIPGPEAEALVTARKIRELRETTGQHGEQLASLVEQLRALTEQVAQTTARSYGPGSHRRLRVHAREVGVGICQLDGVVTDDIASGGAGKPRQQVPVPAGVGVGAVRGPIEHLPDSSERSVVSLTEIGGFPVTEDGPQPADARDRGAPGRR